MRLAPPGQVVRSFIAIRRSHSFGIKDRDVRPISHIQPAPAGNSKKLCRLRGDLLNCTFQGHCLPLPHPGAEHVSRITRITEHIDVGTTVAKADHNVRVIEKLGHAVDLRIERREDEFILDIVFEREIKQGVDVILALLARNFRDGMPSNFFNAGFLTSCRMIRSKSAKLIGFFNSSRKAFRNSVSA